MAAFRGESDIAKGAAATVRALLRINFRIYGEPAQRRSRESSRRAETIVSLDFESTPLTHPSLPDAGTEGPRVAENRGEPADRPFSSRDVRATARYPAIDILGCALTLSAVEKKRIDVYRREILILR